MSRLADYFVVVGFDHEKERSGKSTGIIVQRFPEHDWDDTPFIDGIEWFCQPQGWALSSERQEPRFFVSVLTDIDANRHYCACLCFNETVSITPSKPVDEEEDTVESDGSPSNLPARSVTHHHSIMYAPKCLVLVSRLDYIETFRNCLGVIYTVYIENLPIPLETLVGNILGCIQVPPPGGPQVRFSIGAGDRQALQPPLSISLPVTHCSVHLLFQELGIRNVLVLFCAVMTEQKILFQSRSYSRLTDACRALTALMYPFKYSHVYIPLLPAALVEILSTPTPFVMGVHSSLKTDVSELMDVIVADLDGGNIIVPDGLSLSLLPEPLLTNTQESLSLVLQPLLCCADHAFPPTVTNRPSPPPLLDKEIRAVFMRTFAQLLQGYRSCLTIIRIHPKPVITFHKAAFLGERMLTECDFTIRVLDCMFFTSFVSERGPPWRPCDFWDELYSNMQEILKSEIQDGRSIFQHIQENAQILYLNENPNPQAYVQKILKPPDGAYTRIHQPAFPKIDHQQVQNVINDGLAKNNLKSMLSSLKPVSPHIVPMGPPISSLGDSNLLSNSARRLEVLRSCINCIFENKISDARKTFPAVLRALKSRAARLALCTELAQHVIGNKAMLEHQQFDLVVRLMNCALQDGSSMDEYGIAAALLPLATAFCRKLCTGVIQFAYTCIQEHPVWQNQQFWEAVFYQDVQKEIRSLYLESSASAKCFTNIMYNSSSLDSTHFSIRDRSRFMRGQEPSALEIAAEQMRIWPTIDPEMQKELIANEESTLYSQAIHYANRMVYLLVPLDVGNRSSRVDRGMVEDERASVSITNRSSVAESDSIDAESGFEDQDPCETGASVIRLVSRFVDKVCTEGGVSSEHIRSLHQMIPGVVHMHIETLEAVYRESKRLPPIQKPKILTPAMLQGEETLAEGLRVYLVPDGREEGLGGAVGGLPLLPAEGAIFVTNYRIIFKGTPLDPFACEQTVVRSFPIMSMTKEKRIAAQYLGHLDQWLQEGYQLRSSTFQLIRVAFDEEVSPESIENFRKLIHKTRHPPHIFHHFAFSGQVAVSQTPLHKGKEKNATLKGFAKKTLLKTARKAGFKQKGSSKRQKYVLPNFKNEEYKYTTIPRSASSPFNDVDNISVEEYDIETSPGVILNTDAKTLEKISERSYVRDWVRLKLVPDAGSNINKSKETFRLTQINGAYMMCRSYPALFVMPNSVPDDSIKKFYRCYRHGRIPVITWRHPHSKALLLRGAGYYSKGVMGMLKSHQSTSGVSNSESHSSAEQERYISAIVSATPSCTLRNSSVWGLSDSSLSINSLLLAAEDSVMSPESLKRMSIYNKQINMMTYTGMFTRSSGGKGGKNFGRWGSLKERRVGIHGSQSVNQISGTNVSGPRYSVDSDSVGENVQTFQRAVLYVLGEKAQMKAMKMEPSLKTDFIPIEYPDIRHTKAAFKKLMRTCVPSRANLDPEYSFYKLVEHSEWLQQIQNIMQLSGAVVDLLDVQGSSVMLCLEDGWDITCQISSLAQLCLDPYYRTIDGFRVLIEKEWLAFGHRFSHRSNLSVTSQTGGFAPTFLQFLDAVHQIVCQFPLAFEFNDYYLRFLAYHSVSCRFRTFLLDYELERVECGIAAAEDKRGSLTFHHKSVDTGSDDEIYPGGRLAGSHVGPNLGISVFDYIEKLHTRTSMFFNFMYTPDFEHPVLRPQSMLPNLDLWQYYTSEELAHGAPYDPEIIQMDNMHEEEMQAADGLRTSERKMITLGYHKVERYIPDAFTYLLEEIHKLELELGHLPQKWKMLWEQLELPTTDSLTRQGSFSRQMVRSHGRLLHKRSTLEILMRGKIVSSGNPADVSSTHVFFHPHRFERYNFTTLSYCDLCSNVLWGPVKTGMRCADCGYSCHDKCVDRVQKSCTKYKGVTDDNFGNQTLSRTGDTSSVNSSMNTSDYRRFPMQDDENCTHEGYLHKRGALLKGWKQRWFVLDSTKHQLRYYDAMEDSHCKGYIDLGEVMSVTQASPTAGAPKKTDDKSFFDLRTNRRTYYFCASDAASAQEWIEKLQACLQ